MPHLKGLLDLKDTKKDKIVSLFRLALELEAKKLYSGSVSSSAVLLFLEPSTRTRVSFEMACHRQGILPVVIQGKAATSLEKEETLEDTFLNLAAMQPMAIIIRAGDDYNITDVSREIKVPIINAGWGVKGHPTQALLDTFTLWKKWGTLENKKILILGDVIHSRVAQSHFELMRILGYEVRVFAPPAFLPKEPGIKNFTNLNEALAWCDTVMALRTQKERHGSQFSIKDFNAEWGLHSGNIQTLRQDAFIMHPGPVNWGIELAEDIKNDSRNIIIPQVESGVLIRQALLKLFQEGAW